jgi:hypothetical protein
LFIGGQNPYVLHNGKKLFFPEYLEGQELRVAYKSLFTEQHPSSAHRYANSFDELQGKILLDIGAAEGIFALDVIDYVKKVYLFECDEQWIKPLKKTFQPWMDKVVFVRKFVTDKNIGDSITIDEFLKDKEQNNLFIKMDIEGEELNALHGARKILNNGKNIALAVCTYHKENDAKDVSEFFQSIGYNYEFTKGFLFLSPFLRKGVCRGWSQSTLNE